MVARRFAQALGARGAPAASGLHRRLLVAQDGVVSRRGHRPVEHREPGRGSLHPGGGAGECPPRADVPWARLRDGGRVEQRPFVLAELEPELGPPTAGVDSCRVEIQDLVERGGLLRRLSGERADPGQPQPGIGVHRLLVGERLELEERLLQMALGELQRAERLTGRGEVRFPAQCTVEGGPRVRGAPRGGERPGLVEVAAGPKRAHRLASCQRSPDHREPGEQQRRCPEQPARAA